MTFRRRTLCALGGALGIAAAGVVQVSAKGGPPAPTVYQVTSTVFDTDVFGNATLAQGDDPLAGSADYTASGGVISQIDTSNVDWNLDLRNSSRGFYLNLLTTGGGAVPGLPVGVTFYSGRIVSRCFAPTGGTSGYSWFKITDDPNCAMRVNFTAGATTYTLVMSPGYAGTGLALVHCNAVNGSSCVDWTVTPNANASNAGVANLYVITKGGNEKFVASCKLTFRMQITYP